jgi:UDP:flavonoid glycosyltransferase YjiC (YdhE family)
MAPQRSYLFVTWEGGGNIPPVLGLARRLSARGHAVRVLTEPCLEGVVRESGAEFIGFQRHFVRTDRTEDIIGDWEPKTPIGALKRTLATVILGPAGIVAEETRRVLETEAVDVIVADVMVPGALLAAEAAGLPRVVLFHMPEYLPGPGRPAAGPGFLPRNDLLGRLRDGFMTRVFLRLLAKHVPGINEARRGLGLPPIDGPRDILDVYHRADRRLIQTCEAFDFPITPAPPNVRYVGPVLDEPDWTGGWEDPWPEGDARPLVVASLSSTFQNQGDALRRIIEALGGLDVRGLVTLGPAMAGEAFDLPANVRTVESAPHGRVFPRAAAVVTHAGHGTVMRALSHGLPLVCVPMGRDQLDNATKVAARGAGLRLKPTARPARIRDAVRRVLDDDRYRSAARRLMERIATDAAEDRGVRELERVGLEEREHASMV